MGAYWLNDCVPTLQKNLGGKFKLYSGYQDRSRSSGGFDTICGILIHHDADSTSGSDDSVLDYEYVNADDSPIGNFHVQRDGDIWLGAAGASNHAGKGGPVPTSKGTVPKDAGNKFLIGIEASNNGIGEAWNNTQLDSYLNLVAELCKFYKLDPLTDIYGHWTWCEPSCPGRKVDPAGPTPKYPKFGGTSGCNKWNINEFRKEVKSRISTTPSPGPSPTPPVPPIPKGVSDMLPMIGKYPNNGGWVVSFDGGVTHKGIRDKNWANSVIAGGAVDAKGRKVVTDWGPVDDFDSNSQVSSLIGRHTGGNW